MQKGFSNRDKKEEREKQHFIPILRSRKAARNGPKKICLDYKLLMGLA
jgi:hypothetical protein